MACPVLPGTVFYGIVPAPPPPPPDAVAAASAADPNVGQRIESQLCAKLVSSADECIDGQPGTTDRMKYTVSECVNQSPNSPRNPLLLTLSPSAPMSAGDPYEGQFCNIVYYTKRSLGQVVP